ncbi:14545_t:CDS:2, partial [Cetraspora pellucida]
MKEFDDEWWPLVTNFWHFESSTRKEDVPIEKRRKAKVREAGLCHAKIKVSWYIAKQKVCVEWFQAPQAIRTLVEKEAVKNYSVPAIVNAVKEYASENLNLGMSVKELRWREVANIKYKVRGPQNMYFTGTSELAPDIQDSISLLQKEGYQVESYKTHYQSSIEAKSIVKVFPGLTKGEQECDHLPLLLQVTTTNALESYHSELKRTTSPQYCLVGTCNKIIALDLKKQLDSDYVAFKFRVKKISAVGVDNDILKEIHKFSFPVQKLIVNEVFAVNDRIEKGKGLPGLMSLECHCLFFRKYMLPCKHIFHEQIYSFRKLLMINTWKKFQQMFDENGLEIYEHRELVSLESFEKDEVNKAAENRKLTVNELMERTRN